MATETLINRSLPERWFRYCASESELNAAVPIAFSYYSLTLGADAFAFAYGVVHMTSVYARIKNWLYPGSARVSPILAFSTLIGIVVAGGPTIAAISGYRTYLGWRYGTLQTLDRVYLP